MDWFSHQLLADRLYHISDRGMDSIYLYTGNDQAVLFDTGFGIGDLKEYVRTITDKPLKVFGTHGHPDHALGSYLFDEVLMHPDDVKMNNFPMSDEEAAEMVSGFFEGKTPEGFDLNHYKERKPYPLPIDKDFYDFEDFSIKVFHTPGHTTGQLAFLIEPENYLIIGDTLVHNKPWCHLEESADLATYLKSIELIKDLSKKGAVVYCGHSPEPIPPGIIDEYPSFIRRVLNGEVKGVIEHPFVGPGMAYTMKEPYGIMGPVPLSEEILRFIRYSDSTNPVDYDCKFWSVPKDFRKTAEVVNSVFKNVMDLPSDKCREELDRIKTYRLKVRDMLPVLLEKRENLVDGLNDDFKEYAGSREYSLLTASVFRSQGIPARVRTGFKADIKAGKFVDQWISEAYLLDEKRWIKIDSQRMLFEFSDDEFINAGWIFLDLTEGSRDPAETGRTGEFGWISAVKVLLCDFYNIVHDEPWYEPDTEIFRKLNMEEAEDYKKLTGRLSKKEIELIREIALLLCSPDRNLNDMIKLYQDNKVLH